MLSRLLGIFVTRVSSPQSEFKFRFFETVNIVRIHLQYRSLLKYETCVINML